MRTLNGATPIDILNHVLDLIRYAYRQNRRVSDIYAPEQFIREALKLQVHGVPDTPITTLFGANFHDHKSNIYVVEV